MPRKPPRKPKLQPVRSPSITRQVQEHFRIGPQSRDPARSEVLLDRLFLHPTFFHVNLQKRFEKAGHELTDGHRTAIQSELRVRLLSALKRHQSPKPYAYLRGLRDKVITAYLQRFEPDRAPRWGRRH